MMKTVIAAALVIATLSGCQSDGNQPTAEEAAIVTNAAPMPTEAVAMEANAAYMALIQEKFESGSEKAKAVMMACDTFQLSEEVLRKAREEYREKSDTGIDQCFVKYDKYGSFFKNKPDVVENYYANREVIISNLEPESLVEKAEENAKSIGQSISDGLEATGNWIGETLTWAGSALKSNEEEEPAPKQ